MQTCNHFSALMLLVGWHPGCRDHAPAINPQRFFFERSFGALTLPGAPILTAIFQVDQG